MSNKRGFTLLEAVIALLLAASGLALVFQSLSGAAKLQAGIREMERCGIIAESLLANRQYLVKNSSGITDDIVWNITVEPVMKNQRDQQLVRVQIIAAGPSGRQVVLVTEVLRNQP